MSSPALEYIPDAARPVALIVRGRLKAGGASFFTRPANQLQVGRLRHPAGTRVAAHTHRRLPRGSGGGFPQEVLAVRSGKVRVRVYGDDRRPLGSRLLAAGDLVLFFRGGHALDVLRGCDIFEVRQGPFRGDAGKLRY